MHDLDLLWGMFTKEPSGYADRTGVQCPFCQTLSNPHIERCLIIPGNDQYDASKFYDMDVRGDVTALEFWNETCDHRWALVFGEHKGAVFSRIVPLPDRVVED